jgi:uncharacterized membrane protein (DUF373 family)
MTGAGGPPRSRQHASGLQARSVHALISAERVIFFVVGAMFFIAAFGLAIRSMGDLWNLVTGPSASFAVDGAQFLNSMLLVLMLVELAYTVIATLGGSELSAEPFLIVGLIAVIRRILVITITSPQASGVNESGRAAASSSGWLSQPVELGILTAVVLVFVVSIVLLRRSPAPQHDDLYLDH